MTLRSTWRLVLKEVRLGPRSPIFFMVIGVPFLITFLIAGVFGTLFEQTPRLAIADLGDSRVTAEALALDGIEVTIVESADDLRAVVEGHDVDAGLVLPAGFDAAAAAGEDPGAEFFVSGSSLASTRAILASVVTDLVEEVTGAGPDVTATVTRLGEDDGVPIGDRLVPMMVFYAVVMAGLYYPAASLVEDREQRTIDALLVTPVQMGDILVSKGIVATVLAVGMAMVTLALNSAFGGQPLLLLAILTVGGVMLSEIGIVLGLWARDANTMFTAIKGGGIVVFLPVVFMIWPDLPQWIPRLVPTYYFLAPVYEVGVLGGGMGDVWIDVIAGAAICLALAPLVAAYARRVERRLATAAA
jgi:ABC-2 type transport system permease protein